MLPTPRALLLALVLFVTSGLGAAAQPLPEPEGPVLLTLSEAGGQTLGLDRAALAALPATTLRTTTIWTVGPQAFTGVTLRDLMTRLGTRGQAVRAHAANDYAIDIPWLDVASGSALIAYARNGKPMSVRDKGPLWLVYPYDSAPVFRQETYHARSVWQLDRVEVIP